MKKSIYSVLDTVAQEHGNLFLLKNDQLASKEFGTAVQKGDSPWSKHPSDFTLMNLGEFDTETGKISQDQIKVVATASQFVENTQVQQSIQSTEKQ